ncbi:hypothetical protein MBLNU459_g2881t1 [Dothideomycetes sp. NU459]
MARKARQRISYVLPLANSSGGHRLGVNGLAVDGETSTLYSGGRDGVICAWDLDLDLTRSSDRDRFLPPPSPNAKPAPPVASRWRQQVQAHTHWINDIVLAQSNQALVSASSDVTVKIWRPAARDPLPPQTIGLHSDYVKVLASPRSHADWVASGGLDRKIFLWDLNGAGQTLTIDVGQDEGVSGLSRDKGSVYALAATPSIIASGGPESTVRMWDPKSAKRITKFVGHTDNIRDILISDDGCTVMTASSDQTVKVWSVTAGRCMHTLTMHDASVWSLWSTHPQLSVFYSSDRSGLIAKTDTRGCAEPEDGMSVALAQEHESVHKVVQAGDYLWTATSRPSINRWRDVNTENAEIEMPENYKQHRFSIGTVRSRLPSPPAQAPQSPTRTTTENIQIPLKHTLRLSNTAYYPRPVTRDRNASSTSLVDDADAETLQPFRAAPDSSIEGQNGLIKHVMLNDRKRVLTLDTAGECMMWDLLKCVPIKSFGNRHLEDVQPEVSTVDTVPNWCTVDTRTGTLAVTLEENNAFDAEMYADELDLEEHIDFKEDQRINLGKWVLRYLFSNLIAEEVRRDQQYRKYLMNNARQQKLERENAPTSIQMPATQSNGWHDTSAPTTTTTLKPTNGHSAIQTPGLVIGAATPAFFGSPARTRDSGAAASEDGAPLEKRVSGQSGGRKSVDRGSDYFSTAMSNTAGLTSPAATIKLPNTPGAEAALEEPGTPVPDDSKDTPSKFGKKFKMNMSFSMKRLGKTTTNENPKPAVVEESKEEVESDSHSSKTSNSRVVDDNFFGTLQKIRFAYEDDIQSQTQRQSAMDAAGGALGSSKDLELPSAITPSMPSETPVLKPPRNTTILIQEDRPEAGGVSDLFEGKVSSTAEMADLIEKIAPMWLGECLLRNQIPFKEVVKISFVLEPFKGELPSIAAGGNNRLNANRMLRARKILAYVAERIEPASTQSAPAPAPPPPPPATSSSASDDTEDPFADPSPPSPPPPRAPAAPAEPLLPEDYLELYCNGQLIPPKMTLATIRAHVWRGGGDVALFYRANGRKPILHAPRPVSRGAPPLAHVSVPQHQHQHQQYGGAGAGAVAEDREAQFSGAAESVRSASGGASD